MHIPATITHLTVNVGIYPKPEKTGINKPGGPVSIMMTHIIMKGLENCILYNSRRNKLVILLFMQSCSSSQHIVLNLQLVPVLHIPLDFLMFVLKCKCPVALPHSAMGRSAVCDCGIS